MIKQNVRSRQGSEDGELRILEIGMGPGSSLDFFSEGTLKMYVSTNLIYPNSSQISQGKS